MGWWNDNAREERVSKKRGFFSRDEHEYVEARLVDRRGPRSELREPRQRRVDNTGRYIYR